MNNPDNSASKKPKIISVRGAKVHNLKNVSLDLPRNKLIVITGVSGSGKSSLAFDTIYAEGQRRFVESLSSYARQFLERMGKPDVEQITGIPPAVAIEQKTITRNPRSTVGTTTEVYDYLRLLFGRIGKTFCKNCGSIVRKDTPQLALQTLREWADGDRLYVLFPLRHHGNHSLADELDNIRKQGFFRVTLADSNEIFDLNEQSLPEKIGIKDVLTLVDRVVLHEDKDTLTRLNDSLETAFRESDGRCIVRNLTTGGEVHFSSRYECSTCHIVYQEPEPRLFSFNNPFGACPTCEGFGRAIGIDDALVFPDTALSLQDNAIHPFRTTAHSEYLRSLLREAPRFDVRTNVPIAELRAEEMSFVRLGGGSYIGVNGFFSMIQEQSAQKMHYRVLLSRYRGYTRCPECRGSRLKESARQVFVGGRSMGAVVAMTLEEAAKFFATLDLSEYETVIAGRILKEIVGRLNLLVEIGLGYLTLDRLSHTLSGGESQRINLASSIGSSLVGALYVLDEPSIGMHPRDTERMIGIMKKLRNLGNTVIVVEHDSDVMRQADVIVDMGPKAGEHGGKVVAQGNYEEITQNPLSLTGQYLSGKCSIPTPKKKDRKKGNGKKLTIVKPTANNLKGESVEIPLGCMTVITGVSGSGKSTLIHEVLYSTLQRLKSGTGNSASETILGAEEIEMVEMIDQSPIGKSPRSTPATYTKAFDAIREVFSETQAAKQMGWKPGYFSFNVPGGRCETCEGDGTVKIEMQFLADLYLECEDCKGTRYKKEAQHIHFKNKSVVDVLNMTVDEALEFFAGMKKVVSKLKVLSDVGLGYIRLGQPGTTLSGGEAQRVKLASHLQVDSDEKILFIFDEPTTGLHFDDISKLLACFRQLVKRGHSLVIIEHNVDIMKSADWIIDLGPEAGAQGGRVVATGTPEDIANVAESHTGRFLAKILG